MAFVRMVRRSRSARYTDVPVLRIVVSSMTKYVSQSRSRARREPSASASETPYIVHSLSGCQWCHYGGGSCDQRRACTGVSPRNRSGGRAMRSLYW
ncbi:hypothetical protein CY34DRAFT_146328 [Suillus luteus UH-Slu-Lm8-n1]|uniref:Uncharacterized protein n=1 Tax=Suillus luteus UH-Slu-Lm8-n1 TaxID=930992 RepID=A0A0D0BGS2_9AGAM|nr:hypothetical protein CY34DRAFT_146328 [Suillus luteus UH-Slu-Lm8-n1]